MLIANPIYDVVFKYLLDDEKVARLILSALLDEEVESLEYRATEARAELRGAGVCILRMDFAATVRMASGDSKLVLIEIQKAQSSYDILRFRKYLGTQYGNPDNVILGPEGRKEALPILSIYFLGEGLEHIDAPVVRVVRTYRDAASGEAIGQRDPFIESLTHDSIVVQLPRLKARRRNELEQLLSVFDQGRISGDPHQLLITNEELPERYQEVIRRLQRAMAEPKVRHEMDLEDEFLQTLLDMEKAMAAKDAALEAKDAALEEERRASAAKDRLIEELRQKLGQG